MRGLLGRIVGGRGGERETRVGVFVDGPNVLRSEFDVDLDDVSEVVRTRGRPVLVRLYVDEHATPGLVQAAEAHGFEVVTTSGDVDVKLAVDATAAAVREEIDLLAIVSRDMDFKPVMETAAQRGVRTLAIAPGAYGRSDALRSVAHDAVTLGE
jgi:uncharacterized protein (TIGR00288 family)